MNKPCFAAAVVLGFPAAGNAAHCQLLAYADWEEPTWMPGSIAEQNDWYFSGTAAGHHVVEAGKNGSPAAPTNGGSQIHASISSAKVDFLRESWVDVRDQWAARNPANNIVHADLDFFMPASDSLDLHGITLYNTGNFVLGAVYFTSFQSAVHVSSLAGDVNVTTNLLGAYATDRWNHLDVYADYSARLFTAKINGKTVAESSFIDGGAFGDVDLSNFSVTTNSVFFTDNYRVRAERPDASASTPSPDSLLLFATGMSHPVMAALRRKRLKLKNTVGTDRLAQCLSARNAFLTG